MKELEGNTKKSKKNHHTFYFLSNLKMIFACMDSAAHTSFLRNEKINLMNILFLALVVTEGHAQVLLQEEV